MIIEASTNLGLMPPADDHEPGTRKAPDALRALGLHDALMPVEVLRVEATPYLPDEGSRAAIRNASAIAEHAVRVADAVEAAVRADRFPLVLGGDCSLLLGAMLGLRRIGRTGLVFIDGHTDFYLPEQSSTGGAAGMDLALATGWGPVLLTDLEGRRPYVMPGLVAVLGNRDHVERPVAPVPDVDKSGMHYRSLEVMRTNGVLESTWTAIAALRSQIDRYWVHLDVDVIDSTLMPAVDSPQDDGLSWHEIEAVLEAALDGGAIGLQVTIYDPDRDPDLLAGKQLVDLMLKVLKKI